MKKFRAEVAEKALQESNETIISPDFTLFLIFDIYSLNKRNKTLPSTLSCFSSSCSEPLEIEIGVQFSFSFFSFVLLVKGLEPGGRSLMFSYSFDRIGMWSGRRRELLDFEGRKEGREDVCGN